MHNFDFDKIYRQYYPWVYYLCLQYLNYHEADANDTAQNVFLLLYQNEARISDETKVKAWLLSTTTRQCLKLMRKRSADYRYIAAESDISDLPDSVRISDQNEIVETIPNRFLDENLDIYQDAVMDRLSEKEQHLVVFIRQKYLCVRPRSKQQTRHEKQRKPVTRRRTAR